MAPPKSKKKSGRAVAAVDAAAAVPDSNTDPEASLKSNRRSTKPGHEIDEIFAHAKAKKKGKKENEEKKSVSEHSLKPNSKTTKNKKNKKNMKMAAALDADAPEAKANRRRTTDGLAIYSAAELGFGNPTAGGTSLCPFDCDCCF